MGWVKERVKGNTGEVRFNEIIAYKFSELTDNFNTFWATETTTDTVGQLVTSTIGGTGWEYNEMASGSHGSVTSADGNLKCAVVTPGGTGYEGVQTTTAISLIQGAEYKLSVKGYLNSGSNDAQVLLSTTKLATNPSPVGITYPTGIDSSMNLVWSDDVVADEDGSNPPTKEFTFTTGVTQSVYILVVAVDNTEAFDLWLQSVSLQQQSTYSGGSA